MWQKAVTQLDTKQWLPITFNINWNLNVWHMCVNIEMVNLHIANQFGLLSNLSISLYIIYNNKAWSVLDEKRLPPPSLKTCQSNFEYVNYRGRAKPWLACWNAVAWLEQIQIWNFDISRYFVLRTIKECVKYKTWFSYQWSYFGTWNHPSSFLYVTRISCSDGANTNDRGN